MSEANRTLSDLHEDESSMIGHDIVEDRQQSGLISLGDVILLLYLSLVFLAAVSLNLSILLVFMRKPSLRTTSNRWAEGYQKSTPTLLGVKQLFSCDTAPLEQSITRIVPPIFLYFLTDLLKHF